MYLLQYESEGDVVILNWLPLASMQPVFPSNQFPDTPVVSRYLLVTRNVLYRSNLKIWVTL